MGGLGIAHPMRLALDHDLALIRMDDSCEHLHEGRLAGAVLSDEGVHAPSLDREAHVGHCLLAAVALRQTAQLDERKLRLLAHRGYAAVTPPSTLMMFPVDLLERGPARKATASATSSG